MARLLLRWAAVACVAPLVSACGGGMSHATSVIPSAAGTSGSAASGAVAPVPQGAVRGIRTIVHLPLRNAAELENLVAQQSQEGSPEYHQFLTPAQFAQRYAPATTDLQAAAKTLQAMGFTTHVTTQSVLADADQSTVERTFNVKLRSSLSHGRSSLAADRAPTVPQSLRTLDAAVVVTPKWIAHKDSVRANGFQSVDAPDDRYGGYSEYWNTDLKQAYSYPSTQVADGTGRTIGIVMANAPLQSDLDAYFAHEKYTAVSGKPSPQFQLVNVDGGGPFDPNLSDEVSLDVQESLGSAPGANAIVYSIPDLSFQSTYDAFSQVVTDNRADVINFSAGLGELFFTPPYWGDSSGVALVQAFHDLFLQGNAQGQTFVISSGDLGAKQCPSISADGTALVSPMVLCPQWPADDPAVTAVGGTNLKTTTLPPPPTPGYPYRYALTSQYLAENANGDPLAIDIFYTGGPAFSGETWGSGGGVSTIFPVPGYQRLVTNVVRNGRNSPDVAMHMGGCPYGAVSPCSPDRSFDVIYLGGHRVGLIGTSASAPEFAGLLAVTEQNLGTRLGNANWYLYALSSASHDRVFHHKDIPGDSGGWNTNPSGYDRVIGVGTPYGNVFSGRLAPLAGDPQTPSNP